MRAFVVAGAAATGKSTLGSALARRVRAPLLDLDTLTNPLLDALTDLVAPGGGHWNDPGLRARVRPARYAALRDAARAQVSLGLDVVVVAPFTAELAGGPEWDLLAAALKPAQICVLWLDLPLARRIERMTVRGEPRDRTAHAAGTDEPAPPRVPHVHLDATLSTPDQLGSVPGL